MSKKKPKVTDDFLTDMDRELLVDVKSGDLPPMQYPDSVIHSNLALELLGIDGLPLPRTHYGDEASDNPYLSRSQLRQVANIVCERLPYMTMADWNNATIGEQVTWMRQAAKRKQSGKRRTGRRSKGEAPADQLIVSAIRSLLAEHGRDKPPTGRTISESLQGSATAMTVSRFVKKHWGNQRQFAAAWRRGAVELILNSIERVDSVGHVEFDEEQLDRNGKRRAGRTPGANDDAFDN